MSVNVQLGNELRRISGRAVINSKQIITALNYVPADSTTLFNHSNNSIIHVTEREKNLWNNSFSGKWEDLLNKPDISADCNDKFLFTDSNGNIIAQIDKEGFKTTEVYIRGTSVRDLISMKKSFSGYYSDLINAPNIYDDSSSALTICDPEGYIIGKFDYNGLTVLDLFLGTSNLSVSNQLVESNKLISSHIENSNIHLSSLDKENINSINQHINNTDIHITQSLKSNMNLHLTNADIHVNSFQKNKWDTTTKNFDSHNYNDFIHVSDFEKQKWNSINNFSGSYLDLKDAPNITLDSKEDSLVICDASGYIIGKFNDKGLTTSELFLNDSDIGVSKRITNLINFTSSHVESSSIHLSSSDKESINNINQHINNTEIHVTLSYKEKWDTTSSDFKSHSSNQIIHVTQAEREKWNSINNFSGSYLDLKDAPNIITDETDSTYIIKDDTGYKIAEFDSDGLTTVALFVKNSNNEIKNILDIIKENIDSIQIDYETYLAFDITKIVE